MGCPFFIHVLFGTSAKLAQVGRREIIRVFGMNKSGIKTKTVIMLAIVGAVFLFGQQSGAQTKTTPSNQAQLQLSYAPLVSTASPAVVNVYTSKTVSVRRFAPLFNDPFFQQFFGDRIRRSVPGPKRKVQNSLGSGVIVSPDGTIVTNHHVIEGAEEIKVVLSDKREFAATIIGTDERTDLAVLKINNSGKDFSFIEFSDSDKTEVGDIVLAIGNPFGVGQTVTSGIVSALARTQVGVSDLGSFIQTDAAINPGNSGGALIGMDGRLVGINTAIFSKTGGSMGIGFAIPSNMVNSVISAIKLSGRVVRPWFGAAGQAVTAVIAQNIGLERPSGVMITNVFEGGPAERSGVRRGDVILHMAGHEVQNPQDLRFRIATLSPGGRVDISIWRNGNLKNISMALETPPQKPPKNETTIKGPNPLAGAMLANLSPYVVDELGLPMSKIMGKLMGKISGVIIMKITKGSNAARFGFAQGDILKEINNTLIVSVKDAARALGARVTTWNISIDRGGQEMRMAIR